MFNKKYRLSINTIKKIETCGYKEEPATKPKFVYDSSSGNYHLIPNDLKLAEEIAGEIEDKLRRLEKELDKQLDDKFIVEIKKIRGKTYGYIESKGGIFDVDGYIGAKNIFSFLRITIGEKRYELMCIRFAIVENTVKSILKTLQFETYYYNKKIKSYELYPKTLEDGIVSNGDMEGSYYYNPRVSFYDAEQTIINAFLEFVELDLKVRK